MNRNDERERAERLGGGVGFLFTGHPVIALLVMCFGFRNLVIGAAVLIAIIIGLGP
jgi:hypothetical protein